jgi:hypothetical protein
VLRVHELECFRDALDSSGYPTYDVPLSPEEMAEVEFARNKAHKSLLKGSQVKVYATRECPPVWLGNEKKRKGHLELHPSIHHFFQKMQREQIMHLENPARNKAPEHYLRPQLEWKDDREVPFWHLFTELDIFIKDEDKRRTLRAHPNYNNEGAYYDWVYVNFADQEGGAARHRHPSKLLTFVMDPTNKEGKLFALVHSCVDQYPKKQFGDSVLFYHWNLEFEGASVNNHIGAKLHLVPVESISAACYAFEEDSVQLKEGFLGSPSTAGRRNQQERAEVRCHKHVIVCAHLDNWPMEFWNGSGDRRRETIGDQAGAMLLGEEEEVPQPPRKKQKARRKQ